MITNPKRRKRIEEFVDKDHPVMTEYYDVLDSDASIVTIKRKMKAIIERDPDFYDPYIILADLELEKGNREEGRAYIRAAYERAVRRIADMRGDWPETMRWGWLENRHLMRALERWAIILWEDGGTETALDIFRRLLRANPNDNQGTRYCIAAIRLGLGVDWDVPFEVKEGHLAGEAVDAFAVERWFKKNAKKFPDEFAWLPGALKELGYGDE